MTHSAGQMSMLPRSIRLFLTVWFTLFLAFWKMLMLLAVVGSDNQTVSVKEF